MCASDSPGRLGGSPVNHCHRRETACASIRTPRHQIGHHRPIDCGPAASHEVMAAIREPLDFLPGRGIPAGTPKTQFVSVQTVALVAQQSALAHLYAVYHKSASSARGRGINGYQRHADAVISAVPPFLRSPKGGGFLEVFR